MTALGIAGISDGWVVDGKIWRGAQPSPAAFAALAARGCKRVVSLRPSGEVPVEQAQVEAAGMVYHDMCWNGAKGATQQQIRDAIELISFGPGPVFIHCEHGHDRTGTLCACWRILTLGWSVWRAEVEAIEVGELEVWMAISVAQYEHNLRERKP
jgi:protein tyrosine/serine phosphatase